MTAIDASLEHGHGRQAGTPAQLPWAAGRISFGVYGRNSRKTAVTLIAAGATFYLLLALFPALAAFVSIYGFVADPVTVADHIAFLGGFLPAGGVDLIKTQLQNLASQNEAALSFGFIFGLAVALWSANNGIKTLFEAMNIAYDEAEKRSFVRLNLISLGFTLGAIVIAILFIVSVGVVPAVLALSGWATSPRCSFHCCAGPSSSPPLLSAFRALSLWAEPGARQMAVGDLGKRSRDRALAARFHPVLLVPAEFRRLQCHLRIARRRHRLHDVDLDLGHDHHPGSGAEF